MDGMRENSVYMRLRSSILSSRMRQIEPLVSISTSVRAWALISSDSNKCFNLGSEEEDR